MSRNRLDVGEVVCQDDGTEVGKRPRAAPTLKEPFHFFLFGEQVNPHTPTQGKAEQSFQVAQFYLQSLHENLKIPTALELGRVVNRDPWTNESAELPGTCYHPPKPP